MTITLETKRPKPPKKPSNFLVNELFICEKTFMPLTWWWEEDESWKLEVEPAERDWWKAAAMPTFTGHIFVQFPHLTVTVSYKLLHGTLTWTIFFSQNHHYPFQKRLKTTHIIRFVYYRSQRKLGFQHSYTEYRIYHSIITN